MGISFFLFAELPVIGALKCSFLLSKPLNDFNLSLGTGMVASAITAYLIDQAHEKQNVQLSNIMKRQILYDTLCNLRYFIHEDDLVKRFESYYASDYISARLAECQRSLNFSIPFLSADEYESLSSIELVLKSISSNCKKLHEREHYSLYKSIYSDLLYSDPPLTNPFQSYNYEKELIKIENMDPECAYEICMSVILHNMDIQIINKQISIFETIKTDDY